MEAVKRIRVLRVTGLTGDKERAVRRTHAARRVIDRCAEPQGLALGPMPFWGDIGDYTRRTHSGEAGRVEGIE
jgi:hypothetical protein